MGATLRRGPVADEAVVLGSIKLSETSRIVSALTAAHGHVKLVAKGVRAPGHRLAHLLEPGNELQLVFYPRADRELWILADATLHRAALTGAGGLDKLFHLLAALELAQRLLPEREPLPEIARIYSRFLDRWHEAGPAPTWALFFGLEAALLQSFGLGLDAIACGECGAPLRQAARAGYRPQDGSLTCERCSQAPARWIDREGLRDLEAVATCLEAGPLPELDARARRAVGRLLHDHMTFHLPSYRLPRALVWTDDVRR
jgi:DNA repair protein RecO (recombination protein O)